MKQCCLPEKNSGQEDWKELFKRSCNPSKTKLSYEERSFFYLAVGLYLGEGTKSFKRGVIVFGNTDPLILRTFLKFLKVICNVSPNKIKFELNIYDDVSLESALEY